MKPRTSVDPELHTLRSVALSLDGRARQQFESARFNLFSAFEARDQDGARRWAQACRAAVLALDPGELADIALEAIGRIESAID